MAEKRARLRLNRETVRELGRDEMKDVAGGAGLPTQYCTGYYPSINAPCLSVRIPCVATGSICAGN